MQDLIKRIIKQSIADQKFPLAVKTVKLSEEVGELSEAVFITEGYSTYKALKHDSQVIEEAMDVVICALDVAVTSGLKRGLTEVEITNHLTAWGDEKLAKWEGFTK